MPLTKDDRTLSERSRAPSVPGSPAAWLVMAGLVLAALNLRPAIAGLGPVLAEVRRDLDMNGVVAGLLTSLPALCFGLVGLSAPRLARRHGPVAVMLLGLTAVVAGLALRPLAGGTWFFVAASALALAGIAIGNVLMPVLVTRFFPDRVGAVTGLYSTGFALGTAAAAGLTIPATDALGGGWRMGLSVWAALAVLALPPWIAVLLSQRRRAAGAPGPAGRAGATGARGAAVPGEATALPRLTRSATARALAVFFGLQATAAYVTMGWAPQIFRDAGVSAGTSGVLLAVIMGVGVPFNLVLPRIAARMRHQGPLTVVLGGCGLIGYAGLWLAPVGGAWVWAFFLGISNCAFPVALTMIGLRSHTAHGVARLSAFTQSTGYLLCVPGPLLVGTMNEATGGWELPLAFLTVLMFAQIAAGVIAGRDRRIEDGG
ncbi:MFS transporter [Streptomyces sp. B6B3]|uniref:CynX/NimT family MFS transporter n=1 Tax=Streptomyces sp. B6B3 TaxID=3153570 RepID=UPI00325C5DAC